MKRLIVVLGMHRSGTSAVTRALTTLGVEIGDELMPPVDGNNPTGFWEDSDINALNIDILKTLNSDWDRLALIDEACIEILRKSGHFLRATELLRKKLAGVLIFGFKDPRVAKLLSFWKVVFSHCQFDVGYVLAIRHPLSVAKSLKKRDGFDHGKSYFLWLGHVLQSLTDSTGSLRILVDYDLLMSSPAFELNRIARRFELTVDPVDLKVFEASFLDQNLRHTVYQLRDLQLDDACVPLVREVYMALLDVAADKLGLNDAVVQEAIAKWLTEFKRMSAALALIDQLYLQKSVIAMTLNERNIHIGNLSTTLIARDTHIGNLNQAVVDRDAEIAGLAKTLYDKEIHIENLNQMMVDRDQEIAILTKRGQDNKNHIENLNEVVLDRDAEIVKLNDSVVQSNQKVDAIQRSNSWKITKPLRILSQFIFRNSGSYLSANDEFRLHNSSGKLAHIELERNVEKLPKEFNPDIYLELNQDLVASGMDPTLHYLLHGRHEGRIFLPPKIDFLEEGNFKVGCESILLVSHEASRTGAPILSLNLVQSFVSRYNVVVLLLGNGSLTEAFCQTGAAVITSPNLRGNQVLADLFIDQLCEQFKFKFALVNSIESRTVLPALAKYFVPTVSLVHEFASYTRPRQAFRETLFWSGEVVFSTNVTKENAYAEYPDLSGRNVHILPQGRCLLPVDNDGIEKRMLEAMQLRRLIRPKDIATDTVIVLGAGFVQLRKGVDLFIECATRVLRASGGDKCRFVWIGKGYDTENDVSYSVYLADQIRRANLQEHVLFIGETDAIETAYEEADLFLLPSRLDPLPNVAIDAMTHGVPVICFNMTTGIADFLTANGLQNHCVAEYLDTTDMAEKILALATSDDLRKLVAERCQKASVTYFNMKDYVAHLEDLAQDVCDRSRQEEEDTQTILDSGLFRADFSCTPQWQDQSVQAQIRAYVRGWASGLDRRKPYPGFHPGIYLEQHGLAKPDSDPFADYLNNDRPAGPWNCQVISPKIIEEKELQNIERVALHLHIYYPDLLSEIVKRLSLNRICPDLFISISSEKDREYIINEFESYQGRIVDIQLVPNCGRDIGPFLTVFGPTLIANYDFIGHIHTKKSVAVSDVLMGETWYRFLLENLLGGESGCMVDTIITRMNEDASIGMVFPDDPYILGLGTNRTCAEAFAERIGSQKLPEHFIFPMGTMFWARASALLPIMSLKLDWDDYPEEPLAYDGTPLHALERLFSLSLPLSKLCCATTNVIGLTR
jgi:glycosyltransferase involved in cell wall biosynthesis